MTAAGRNARPAWLIECGRMAYGEAWALQRALLAGRQEGRIPDVLMLVEHPPVITLGRAAQAGNVLASPESLAARGVEVFHVERGGDVTYHGPGQLVGYPIVSLAAYNEDISRFVRLLEAALIAALTPWEIAGERLRGYPGVWVGGAKIAAIGLAVRRRVTMHGFALNVDPDLSGFDLINPCGLSRPVTSMSRLLGRAVGLDDVRPEVARAVEAAFDVALVPITPGAAVEGLPALPSDPREASGPARRPA